MLNVTLKNKINGPQWCSGNICLPLFRLAAETLDPKCESWYFLTYGWQFTVQNLEQQYVLLSSDNKTTHRDMTCSVLQAT